MPRVAYGWWVAVVGSLNMVMTSGPTFQGASVLFKAIEDEYGWSRALISGVASIGQLGTSVLSPFQGWLTDRFGSGRMVLVGTVVGGLGLIGLSLITGPLQYYAAFFFVSVGFGVGGFTPSMTAVNAWVQSHRATAMALVIGGSSIAGLLVPPLVWSISVYGWRSTFAAIGVFVLIAGPFVALVVGRRPPADTDADEDDDEVEVVDDDDVAGDGVEGASEGDTGRGGVPAMGDRLRERLHTFTPGEALRTRAFWLISLTHMMTNFSVGTISAHLFLQLRDANGVGLDDAQAASVIPVMVVVAFASQLAGGFAGDTLNKRLVLPFLILGQGASLVVLAFADSLAMAMVFATVWGIGFGGRTPILHAMRGEYFGRRYFGTILGMSALMMGLGMMSAPFIVGRVHDIQGTYQWSLLVLALACAIGAVMIVFAARPESPAARRRAAALAAAGGRAVDTAGS